MTASNAAPQPLGETGPERFQAANGVVIVAPRVPVGAVLVAATLAIPLASTSRRDVLAGPLVAAHWAHAMTEIARRAGARVRVDPVVSTDLVGVTVEAIRGEHNALRALPRWFRAACQVPLGEQLPVLKQRCLSRSRSSEHWSDGIRSALFGQAHRYGIGAAEVTARIRECAPAEVAASLRALLKPPPVLALSVAEPEVLRCWADNLLHNRYEPAAPRCGLPAQRPVSVRLPVNDARIYYLLGTPGVRLGSDDKFAVHVTWAMIGGREGLLDRRLRTEHALTYSLGAFSREFAEGGYGLCMICCQPQALDEVVTQVSDVLTTVADGRFDAPALESAKERLIIQQLLSTQTGRGVAERLCGYEIAGIRTGLADYVTSISGVTAAHVRDVAARYIGVFRESGPLLRPPTMA